MCTVTYLPLSDHDFLLTHNRDEHVTRGVAMLPQKRKVADTEVLYPQDPDAGGTWIAASAQFTLCLLNGGFVKHLRHLPYRHSRGQIIPDFFKYQQVDAFLQQYDFDQLEPFTLIIADHQRNLHEIVFDGRAVCHNKPDPAFPHIWSSVTLYTEAERAARRTYFQRFLEVSPMTQEAIIDFHKNRFEDYVDEGIQINRNGVLRTVSLTSIYKTQTASMYYEDLIHEQIRQLAI